MSNIPPRGVVINDRTYLTDPRGALVPIETIRPMDLLIDEQVHRIMEYATELSQQIARFKGHCFDDIGSLQALIAQDYGATIGGAKGNLTLTSYDGRTRVMVKMQDQLAFGPELQAAKALVDECLSEWTAESNDEIRAIVTRAFQVDKAGQINASSIFMLLRVNIEDERWNMAMDAVRDSIRVLGSKQYLQFQTRDKSDGAWRSIPIDLAAV